VEYPSSSSSSSCTNTATVSTITPEQQKIIKTKIELHQKVFPMHEVVGWYRIDISGGNGIMDGDGDDNNNDDGDADALPTEADLMINNGWMKEYNESPLFVLMDANEKKIPSKSLSLSSERNTGTGSSSNEGDEKDPKKTKNDSKRHDDDDGNDGDQQQKQQQEQEQQEQEPSNTTTVTAKTYNSSQGEDAREKLDRDEQLPLTIYETINTGSGTGTGSGGMAAFVNLDFELETFEPERIAVEKVFQSQPKTTSSGGATPPASATTASPSSNVQASRDSSNPSANPEDAKPSTATGSTKATATAATGSTTTSTARAQTQIESAAGAQIQSLITSVEAMNTRIAVLLDFLHKTKSGEIPPNYALLRQVGSLINQLPLVLGKGVFSDNTSSSGSTPSLEEGKMENPILANEFENEYDDMLIVSFLATIAKTTKSVLSYSARFKVMNDSGRREMGRGRYDRSYKDDF